MYDFMFFGYYAASTGHTFFPVGSEYASLMKSLMTFAAGFTRLLAAELWIFPPRGQHYLEATTFFFSTAFDTFGFFPSEDEV
jgi:hypothetical protein